MRAFKNRKIIAQTSLLLIRLQVFLWKIGNVSIYILQSYRRARKNREMLKFVYIRVKSIIQCHFPHFSMEEINEISPSQKWKMILQLAITCNLDLLFGIDDS